MKTKTYAVLRVLLGWFLRMIFFVIPKDRANEPLLTEGNYLVCSNHLSAVDPIMIAVTLRHQQPRFMAKAELFRVPVLGPLIKALGAFPVDRSGADAGVLRKSVRMLEANCSVGMFPQGTRRPEVDPATTPVRNGAGLICSQSHVQVLPVYIKTQNNRVRFLRPNRIIIGKPISYEEYTSGGVYEKDYAHITGYIFGRICELGAEAEKK